MTWRRTYFCAFDHWTGEWYNRHQLFEHEILFVRHRRIGVGWRGPMLEDGKRRSH